MRSMGFLLVGVVLGLLVYSIALHERAEEKCAARGGVYMKPYCVSAGVLK